MNRIFASCAVVGFLVMFVTSATLAQASGEEMRDPSTTNVPYLSGGVGESEREDMEAAAKDYSLKLVFAQSGGAFVADVQVSIKDSGGATVLDATSGGPLFFAKLPAGNYTVEATFQGIAKRSPISVTATGQQVLDFRW
jgi:Ni2+-binding GTPase involved in maturation of urease and hydrogenase